MAWPQRPGDSSQFESHACKHSREERLKGPISEAEGFNRSVNPA